MTLKITTMEQLKKESEAGAEFFICLGSSGILRSGKWITWDKSMQRFYIFNNIDGSEDELTEAQLMDREYTNIGYAMARGALFKD